MGVTVKSSIARASASGRPIVRVAIYLRKSRAEDGVQDLAKHKEYLISICEKNGWVYELYEEIESSQDLNRAELQRMRQDISLGKIDAVMVHAVDRLSRKTRHFLEIIEDYFAEHKMTRLYVRDVEHDLTNTTTITMLQMQATMSQAEYSFITKRLNEGRKSSIRKGAITGKVIYGYRFDKVDRKVKMIPEESKIVRMIADMTLKGKPYKGICEKLNSLGYRTRAGNLWDIYNVKSIIHSPITRGHIIQEWSDDRGEPELIEVRNSHPAIITDAEYAKIKEITENRAEHYKGLSKAPTHWLQGILTCPFCGKVMTLAGSKPYKKKLPDGSFLRYGDYVYYMRACRPYIKGGERCFNKGCQAVVAEELIKEIVKSHGKEIEKKLEQLKVTDGTEIKNDFQDRVKDLKRAIKENEEEQKSLTRLVAKNKMDEDDYNEAILEYKEEKAQLLTDLRQVEEAGSAVDIEQDIKQNISKMEAVENWDNLSNDEKRELVQVLFMTIEYRRPDKDAPPILDALPYKP